MRDPMKDLNRGLEIIRSHLIDGVCRSGEILVLILAPAGYGKSVLASQIGAASKARFVLDCSCIEPDFSCLARAIIVAITHDSHCCRSGSVLLPRAVEGNLAVDLIDALASLPHEDTCIVLDNVGAGAEPDALRELMRCASSALPAGRLVATSREQGLGVALCTDALLIGPSELRMVTGETRSLLEAATGAPVSDDAIEKAMCVSQGQAAVLRLIARSMCIAPGDDLMQIPIEPNMQGYLQQLAAQQLSRAQIALLYALCLLATGSCCELVQAFHGAVARDLEHLSLCVPFVALVRCGGAVTFAVHELAICAYTDVDFVRDYVDDPKEIRSAALALLDGRGEYERLFRVLLSFGDIDGLVCWAEARGRALLDKGSITVLHEVTARIGPTRVIRSPRLLLLEAASLREVSKFREALKKATVACSLADFEGDGSISVEARLTMARLQMDLGWMGEAAESLQRARETGSEYCCSDTLALIDAYLGLCFVCVGRTREAARAAERAAAASAGSRTPHEILGRVTTSAAAALGVLSGRWDRVLDLCLRIEGLDDASLSLKLQNKGNLGTVLCELGHLRRAEQMLEGTLSELGRREIDGLRHTFTASLSATKAGLGQYLIADELMDAAAAGLEGVGDNLSLAHSLVFQATWQRAKGDHANSLATGERVLEMCSSLSCRWLDWQALLEIAATLLAMGDAAGASRASRRLRIEAMEVDARRHWLTADLILAEVARRDGRPDEGIARLVEHEDYVLTESANWQIAMYVRAFPHLLGMLAAAIGPEALPVHLLRMVLPQDAERTLAAASDILDDEVWRSLAARVVGKADAKHLEQMRETPQCYVRLFGGLEVRIGDREVIDKHWRKRKARLMFAMLVARGGSEMPREQVFEQLWPEMDEARARNNFYVIWGAMKAALVPQATKSTPCPYAENTGGMCRVVRQLVTSDVEEFEQALADATEAERQNNPARAIRAYEQLADLYRGELLPGDIYEDWFAQMRDTFRVEFGDAMLRASKLLACEGDTVRSLLMIRRGLRADPSREDLYQAALSVHIAAGQRSAAIETYTSCRKRLADELGLDPSSETLRLYEQVLAMEDPAEDGWSDPDVSEESQDQ